MSLQIAAQHLASKGRGPDSQLVHMAPTEVAGLHALAKAHGGSLTINPETGLPEAGFLSNILPMVIGAGLSIASGGTLTPMMAGLMTGAGYGLIKGDLKAGLMAGLGAFGGAGMMGSVLGAGAGAAQEAAMANVGAAAPGIEGTTAAMQGGFGGGAPAAAAAAPAAQTVGNVAQATQYGLGPATMGPSAIAEAPMAQAANAAQAAQAAAPVTQMPTQAALNQAAADATTNYMNSGFMDQMKGGIGALAQDPSKLMTGANLKYGLAAAAPMLFQEPKQATYVGDSEQAKYTYSPGRTEKPEYLTSETATPANSYERTWFQPRYTRVMAEGGPVADMSAANAAQGLYIDSKITGFATGGEIDAVQGMNPEIIQSNYGATNPPTGMASGGYAAGGKFLRGPGDGVSDSIPATIGGNQPARLADGEFVVPARIVSELGNGSSEAGARKLYAMMDRVQKARRKTVGKNKVATDSKAEKMLPA